jgi:hypothetical protein
VSSPSPSWGHSSDSSYSSSSDGDDDK